MSRLETIRTVSHGFGKHTSAVETMKRLESVSVECVVDAFRDDQKVRKRGGLWPDAFPEKVALLRKAERPIDRMQGYSRWTLVELDRDEFLRIVRPVWGPENRFYSWSLGEMLAAIK